MNTTAPSTVTHQPITDIQASSCQYPLSVTDATGLTWLAWQEFKDGQDRILAARLPSAALSGPPGSGTLQAGMKDVRVLSGKGQALRPVAIHLDGTFWFAWSEWRDTQWQICLRPLLTGQPGVELVLEQGQALFEPDLCIAGGRLAISWMSQGPRSSVIRLAWVNADGSFDGAARQTVSASPECYRPSLAAGGDSRLYLVYDRFNGTGYDLVSRDCQLPAIGAAPDRQTSGAAPSQALWTDETVISSIPGRWASAPQAARTREGIVVGWYDYGAGAAFAYRSIDLHRQEGKLVQGPVQTLVQGVDWYHDISLHSDSQGNAAFAYTWGKTNVHVRYRGEDDRWTESVIMSFNDGNCSVHPHIRMAEDKHLYLCWQFALKNGHQAHRNAQVVYSSLGLDTFHCLACADAEKTGNTFTLPIPTPKTLDSPPDAATARWLGQHGLGNLKPCFGDIHGQSGISDGVGEIDQYFHFASVVARLDFTALTDHDCYPDWMSPAEWEWNRTTSRLFNLDGQMATLLSYEWTPNEYRYDFGHKNVYYPGSEGEIFRSCDFGGMTPDRLFQSVRRYNAMAFPHHPAATWSMVSAATDWAFHDEEVQRQVEIFSRHAPSEYYSNKSIHTKNNPQLAHCSVQDALARGYHLGFIGGSDSHQMEHGVEGGILAAYLSSLTRENVFKALFERFTWATTGARIHLWFTINGKPMGSIIQTGRGQNLTIKASVLGTGPLTLELLHNNEVILSQQSHEVELEVQLDTVVGLDTNWYYIRITQDDAHQAWSSPIWVETGKGDLT
ncbi:MAG: CehA/McbA family metallohydrolase [Spirochaetota bacterium]